MYATTLTPRQISIGNRKINQLKVLYQQSLPTTTIIPNLRDVAKDLNMTRTVLGEFLSEELNKPFLTKENGFRGRVPFFKFSLAMEKILQKHVMCAKCKLFKLDCECDLEKSEKCHCDTCHIIKEGNSKYCCWCSDKRSEDEIINPEVYLDEVGDIYPKQYGFYWPVDAAYCPPCKISEPISILYRKLREKVENQ